MATKPAGGLGTALLFGVPAVVFFLLFHLLGPILLRHGVSWWNIFHLLLIFPLALMLVASIFGAILDLRTFSRENLRQRLRLCVPDNVAVWLWAAALSGFMYGGNWQDIMAVAASWLALSREKTTQKWLFAAIVMAVFVKRNATLLQPFLQSVRFFEPSAFYAAFFNRFGPQDFMGMPLRDAWWIPAYYLVVMLVFNIGGEELWWRGYVLPRQELAFGNAAWLIHGIAWSVFHLFIQPTL